MTLLADVAALPPALYMRESAPIVRELYSSVQDEQDPVDQRPKIVSGKLTLEADRVVFNPETNLTTLTGNVVATYEGAKLSSVNAEINHETKQGWFRNTVRLEDELGIMTASEIFLDWSSPDSQKVKGHAKNVVLEAYEAHFEAGEISLTGDGGARMEKAWFSTAPGYY
ncbi:MAG: LptA/OstA family protein, partial [Fimbriimonadales bacterium]